MTVAYEYDVLNRLTSVLYPNAMLDVMLTHDDGVNRKGRLTSMADRSGITMFDYDVFGNLTEERKVIDGNTHITSYEYDAADLLVEIVYPSGRTVEYTRNVVGQRAGPRNLNSGISDISAP